MENVSLIPMVVRWLTRNVDVLMWNSPEEILEGIRRNSVLTSPDS